MSRYTRLTIDGQRIDIDVDGRCGVIDHDNWVLTLGTVRRDSAYSTRWIACAEFPVPRLTGKPLGLRRFPTRRAGILALLNLTAWAPERAETRTPLPPEYVVRARMRTSREDSEATALLREYDQLVGRLTALGVDIRKARPHADS